MGDVYLARDTQLGRRVALKVINPRMLGTGAAAEQFLFEARTTACFNHPHIVTVYSVGEHQGMPYVALEFIEGESLRERISEQRLGVKEAMRVGLAVAEALVEAHRRRILHQDLKPENVLIPRDGRVRVVDFGMATVFGHRPETGPLQKVGTHNAPADTWASEDDPRLSAPKSSQELRGTPAYMAPEQWLLKKKSGATDIWALGVVLHELVTGQRPYRTSSIPQLMLKVTARSPVPRDPGLDRVPTQLAELITACLDKDPAGRPSAEQLADTLRQLITPGRRGVPGEQCPFRGLAPFSERHSEYFFGRDDEVEALLERLREEPVLPLVGPTGVGKSSLVEAGLVPRLREGGAWTVLRLRPGSQPFSALAARLATGESTWRQSNPDNLSDEEQGPPNPSGDEATLARRLYAEPKHLNLLLQHAAERERSTVLLVVDQLEELFTQVEDEQTRRRFLQAVCGAADDPEDPVRVVFTLREDFLGRVTGGAEVKAALRRLTVVTRPDSEALQQIMVQPLQAVGHGYDDPSLVPEMVEAVRGVPHCLSLLQFVGSMLWQRRDRAERLLRRAAYDEMGGVAGALARHADGVLEGLAPAQVQQARELLLRLITANGTRRTVSRQALLEGLDGADEVLARLVQARLVSARSSRDDADDGAELELVHEALIRSWDRLARWYGESREDLTFLREVGHVARLWAKHGRGDEELWRGQALAEALRSLERCGARVPAEVTDFLRAGQRRQRRAQRRRRLLLVSGLALLTLTAVVSTVMALVLRDQKRQVQQEQQRAEGQRRLALGRLAAAQREGARSALARGRLLEARAKLRTSLETQDSSMARALWWQLASEPLKWRKALGKSIYGVAFSPDGRRVAAACSDSSLRMLDVQTLQPSNLRGHRDQAFSVAISPDGNQVAAGTWRGAVALWRKGQQGAVKLLRGHTDGVRGVAFSPDGKLLASGSFDGTARLWDAVTGAHRRVLKGHAARVHGVAFSPDSRLLATASLDQTVRLWDAASGSVVATLKGHTGRVYSVAFDPRGRHLVSGGRDRTVRLWDVRRGAALRVLHQAVAPVYVVRYSPGGRLLAAGTMDGAVRLWDASSGSELNTLRDGKAAVHDLAFSPDGQLLAVGGVDKTLRLWRVAAARRRPQQAHTTPVWGASFSPDGKLLASGGHQGVIWIWDVASGATLRALKGHGERVFGVAFGPRGRLLASGGADRTVRLWDPATGATRHVLRGHGGAVIQVAFSADGETLASVGIDRTVRLWATASGAPRGALTGHTGGIYGVAFSPDGKLLASGSTDRTVRLWRLPGGAPAGVLRGHQTTVRSVAFGPGGRLLASGGTDGTARLWGLPSGAAQQVIRVPGARVYELAFHPTGRRLGLPLSDNTARIVDLRGGAAVVLRGHRDEVNTLRFTADGALAATTSDDGTVRVWRTATGRPLWRAPLALPAPPRLLTHGGWVRLDTGKAEAPSGTRWKKVAERRGQLAASSASGRLLCVVTLDGRLEAWDRPGDRLLRHWPHSHAAQLVALQGACASLAQGRARLHLTKDGSTLDLAADATAMARDGQGLLVARKREVQAFGAAGERGARYPADVGVTALARVGSDLVLGFADGAIERVKAAAPTTAGGSPAARPGRQALALSDAPASPVVRLLGGPRGTLMAGFADGTVAIWDLARDGAMLHRHQLHGAVVHLFHAGQKLHAATDLGQHHTLDLSVFHADYCALLSGLRQRVPVVWEGGRPRRRGVRSSDACSSGKR